MKEGEETNTTPAKWFPGSAVGGFDVDVCASATSDLADKNIRETGGLEADWTRYDTAWCNHPYARYESRKWLGKAWRATNQFDGCKTVVTLSKFDPSADWFQDCVKGRASMVMAPGKRISFNGQSNSAKYPNLYSVFGYVPAELRDWMDNPVPEENVETWTVYAP